MDIDARYCIICPVHDKVQIGRAEYDRQMDDPWSRWKCPLCGVTSWFDDDTYEEWEPEDEL
jgi:predicted RNA-binding Zn-ribbon protein involved in translation (DUF1610 family)